MIDSTDKITADIFRFNPPSFSEEQLDRILGSEYGLSGTMEALVGERDQNTRVIAKNGSQYVLKVSSPDETSDAVDLQVKTLEHVRNVDPGLDIPVHVPTRQGLLVTHTVSDEGVSHQVRLLTYLSGTPVLYSQRPSLAGVKKMGVLMGRLCQALSGFDHPAAEHFMPWDLMNGVVVNERMIDRYLPQSLQTSCETLIERLTKESLPLMATLPSQVIHSDIHAGNVLTNPEKPDEIHGIIDFGDLVKRPLVVDLAGALANLVDQYDDVIGVSRQFIAGFRDYCDIDDEQLDLLYDAICAREILTVLLFNFRLAEVGYDSELVNVYLPMTLTGLDRLLQVDHQAFCNAIKSPA